MLLKCSSEHENENKKCEFTEVAPVLVQAYGTIISKHTLLTIQIHYNKKSKTHLWILYKMCIIAAYIKTIWILKSSQHYAI
jgi:hypothetical protein